MYTNHIAQGMCSAGASTCGEETTQKRAATTDNLDRLHSRIPPQRFRSGLSCIAPGQ
jgi:hypothetical protein